MLSSTSFTDMFELPKTLYNLSDLTYRMCEKCNLKESVHSHHLFSKTKLTYKLYKKLLELDFNKQSLCEECHLWKPLSKLTEKEFCEKAGIKTRSKTGLL